MARRGFTSLAQSLHQHTLSAPGNGPQTLSLLHLGGLCGLFPNGLAQPCLLPSGTRSLSPSSFAAGDGLDDSDDATQRPTAPWVRQVVSGVDLMRHPKYNK